MMVMRENGDGNGRRIMAKFAGLREGGAGTDVNVGLEL